MPSYLLPHTQIVKKKKKYVYIKKKTKNLRFQLFNPHPHPHPRPHLEGTLINLYMNKKKEIEKNSLAQERGVALRIEETNRTSQWGFDSYNFCRAFHGGFSEKKIKILSFVCAEIFTE